MAGWIGGSAGIVVGHPADTVKVVQQVSAMKECLPAELTVKVINVVFCLRISTLFTL